MNKFTPLVRLGITEKVQKFFGKDSRILAVFLLGSAARVSMRPESDIDLAIMPESGTSLDILDLSMPGKCCLPEFRCTKKILKELILQEPICWDCMCSSIWIERKFWMHIKPDNVVIIKASIIERAEALSNEITRSMIGLTGFRNVAIHEYQDLDMRIVRRIAEKQYESLIAFCRELGVRIIVK